jgi:hypothetical protein
MISTVSTKWAADVVLQVQSIAPGSPWNYRYCERFSGKLRNECLRQENLYSVKEAQIGIGQWQNTCTCVRPHSSLGNLPLAQISCPDLPFRRPMTATMQPRDIRPNQKYQFGQQD